MRFFSSVLFAALVIKAHCDIYLHNPRGSNNRLDEANRDRANGKRLFDSQNNNRGGSNVGQLYYYEGSTLRLEWTQQHSCGGPNSNCEMVFQYMCDDKLRDGTTTKTIPDKPIKCYNWDCDTDVRFGRHESFASYKNCANRERNMGLFTADQKLNGDKAIYTRQNPNGARRGYECPEERDYYPYWGPTDWVDIAILTNQPDRCDAYKDESANTKKRFYCDLPYDYGGVIPITHLECGFAKYTPDPPADDPTAIVRPIHGEWTEVQSLQNQYLDDSGNVYIDKPACEQTEFSRDNHLGNVDGGQTAFYDWTIPNHIHEQCVLRVRYNISTNDIPHFDNITTVENAMLTSAYNGKKGEGHKDRNGKASYPIAEQYLETVVEKATGEKAFKSPEEAYLREYYLQNNPKVDPFGAWITDDYPALATAGDTPKVQFQLAINTAQYGRTFQDRSHKFAIRSRPSSLDGKVIQNLNVRGKRGNVVQTYPGTEYDFVPNDLVVKKDDYVHIQWTGSNTNPNNNAGQGKQGTDRHNLILLEDAVYMEAGQNGMQALKKYGQLGRSYPKPIVDGELAGLSETTMRNMAILDNVQYGGEMSELDDAGTGYSQEPMMFTQNGVYNVMCTRNNNFSNRSEKGKISVTENSMATRRFDKQVGALTDAGSWVAVKKNALSQAQTVNMVTFPEETKTAFESEPASNYIWVEAQDSPDNAFPLLGANYVTVGVNYEESPLSFATMYRAEDIESNFVEIEDAEFENGVATAEVKEGGVFVVKTTPAYVAITLVSAVVLGLLSVMAWFVFKKFRSSDLGNASARNGV